MEQAIVSGIAHALDEAKITVAGVPDVPGIASKILGPIGRKNIEVDMILQCKFQNCDKPAGGSVHKPHGPVFTLLWLPDCHNDPRGA